MINLKKKKFYVFALLVIIIILGSCFQTRFLNFYIHKKVADIENRFNLEIKYKQIGIEKFTHFIIKDLSMKEKGKEELLKINSSDIKIAFFPLLRGDIEIKNWKASDIDLQFKKNGNESNFDFLFNRKATKDINKAENNESDYAKEVRRSLNMLFRLLPANANLKNIGISYQSQSDSLYLSIPNFALKDNHFSTVIKSTENNNSNSWIAKGTLNDEEHEIELNLYAENKEKIELPFINYRWNAYVAFDSLRLYFNATDGSNDLQTLKGKTTLNGLEIFQHRISPDTVLLNKIDMDFMVNAGKNYFELDSTTNIIFNKLTFHPYLKLQKEDKWHLLASTHVPAFPSMNLFNSLPEGLFHTLHGLQTTGELEYDFSVDIDWNLLDSLKLYSDLRGKNFRITSFGNSELTKMNEPFSYTAYENGEPVRTFEIGSENPMFRPLGSISRYLPLAIMQNEDAGFFYHAGFIPSAIQESLIKDLKENRFVRGGSTISMQLIKNVFLSKNKTIARKLEEMLIVWLIERQHITSKERMMEVYLNIIEWGPLVYGAGEASKFYFGKEPADLTLSESIFLASLVPKPKHFKSSFEGTTLRESNEGFFNIVKDRLIQRELISLEEGETISPWNIKFDGKVKEFLQPSITDSTSMQIP